MFKRRFMTAREAWRAVAINEISIKLLPVKTWYKKVIRSSNIKFNKGNCFYTHVQSNLSADLFTNELM